MDNSAKKDWLGLMIGNSRLHWAKFHQKTLIQTWNSPHQSTAAAATPLDRLPLYIASVVPQQTALWQAYPRARVITLADIPLPGLYQTMGIDRALALWGAVSTDRCPCLIIDAGTALTFTGASEQRFVGGAILPGLRLQLQSLTQKTAALPAVQIQNLPQRWAVETSEAISSGVLYTLLAGLKDFIQDWQQQYLDSQILLTGGDATVLMHFVQVQFPEVAAAIKIDANLIFWGMRSLVAQ
ncbi:MAG: pantothenate kinase [Cyanophyceae cyanobacterium]